MTAVQMIPVDAIRVLNPRARGKARFREIVGNIARLGLKRPITVTCRDDGEPGYDLVCGQGRLEAYVALGQTEVPALVVEAAREERYLMSLVENIARRAQGAGELVRHIAALEARGHSLAQIAAKVDLSESYVSGLLRLLKHGEERLLAAVQHGDVPLAIAVEIAAADDDGLQRILHGLYKKGVLRGRQLRRARMLVEQRRAGGATPDAPRDPRPAKVSADDVARTWCREIQKQELLVRKAQLCERRLDFVVSALRTLLRDPRVVRVLRAEGLDTLPRGLADLVKQP